MFKLLRLTVFFQALGYLMQFGAFFLFAKMLGAEKQGILSIFRASGQIAASLFMFGLPASIIYFVGKNRDLFLPVLKNCVKLFLVVFSLLITFSYLLPIDELSNADLIKRYIPYSFVFAFFLTLSNIFQLSILSIKKYLHYNIFAFGAGFIIFGLSICIWFSSAIENKLTFAMGGYVVTYGVISIYGAILIINETKRITRREVKQPFGEQLKVGLRGFISDIASLLLFRMDLFLVGYYLSLKEVGIYSIALFGTEMVTRVPAWSASIISPMVASNEGGHVRRTVYLYYSATIIALLTGIVFVAGLMAFPNFISNLVGKDFSGVENCALLLLPRVVMQSGVGILAANLAGKGYPWYHPIGCVVPLIFLVILDMILIPKLGINGAALGNSLAYISATIVFWIGFRKYNDVAENVGLEAYWYTIRGYLHGRFLGQ